VQNTPIFLSNLNYIMSSYNPPIENVPIFDSALFREANDETLTIAVADKRYLKYPNAQGTENLQAINVNGVATFNSNGNTITSANNNLLTITKTGTPSTTGLVMNNCGISQDGSNYSNTLGQINMIAGRDFNNNGGVIYQYQQSSSNYVKQYISSGFLKWDSNLSGSLQNVLTLNGTSLTFVPPINSTATIPASNDSSTRVPTTAWVQSAISANIPTQYTYTSQYNGYSGFANIIIPIGCVKFDIKVFGTGGLAGGSSNQPPDPSHPDYWVFLGGCGGGAGVAYKEGIPMIRNGVNYTNTLSYDNSSGTSATGYCEVKFNGVSLCKAYNGGTGSTIAGGAGCSTAPVVNTTWGNWTYWNGEAGAPPTETTTGPNVGQIGGGNFNGGIIGYNKVNSFATGALNQAGQGQQYSALTGLFNWSASPINRGGCIITWYIQS
jgi:hypothetical protein